MAFYKKYIFKVSLIFILLLTGFLCAYTIKNYTGTTSVNQNRFEGTRPSESSGIASNDGESGRQSEMHKPNGIIQHQNGQTDKRNAGLNIGSGIKYNAQIIIYSIAFLALFIAAYYILVHRKSIKIDPHNLGILMLTLVGTGLFLRIIMALIIEGYSSDLNLFKSWAAAASNNLLGVYSSSKSIDYPPLYMYVLSLIGKVANIQALNSYYMLLLKLPSIAADIVSSLFIYKLSRKHFSQEVSMFLMAFYIFNPAVFVNSAIWGQVDSFFTLFVISSVYMLEEGRICFASILYSAGVMMKPQGIIFLPVLFFELVRLKKVRNFLNAAACGLASAFIIILPFSINKGFTWIFKLYSGTVGEYPYASVNAFNFFSLIGKNYAKDTITFLGLSYHNWGMIFIVLITLYSWVLYMKADSKTFIPIVSLIEIAGVFTFSASMHERYLFPAAALAILAFIYLKDKRLPLLAAGFSSTIFINTYYVLYENMKGANSIPYNNILIFTSLLNVILFIYLLKVSFDIAVKKKTFLI